ncbi:putative siderophore transport system permease protein YfiZ [Paenibacillus solanacearum]|uniref:Siderophore transport system permease protein YfiZ n=1 Tax=Paenibacillus solanacearum TaxID=2048548 RepID=A0A916NLM5_9BACL|nr:iron ABC transporter permease [Paenibacillus solanacearum]CAG7650947.1 putative siderophore transport system permease protein YfiZ [Paenibacillus solanacearum]
MNNHTNAWKWVGFLAAAAGLLLCLAASILFGAVNYNWHTAWDAAFHYDEAVSEQVILRTTRMPRAFIAAAIGASLAIAGALMQTLTRNPLASPSVLGVNAGATCLVVIAAVALSVSSMQALAWIAFIGAAAGALAVYALGSIGRDGLTPLKIVLAGSAMTALFASITQGILVLNKQGLSSVLFWLTGTIAGRSPDMLVAVLPYMAVSWLGAWFLSRDMNVLQMGEDTAKGLGQKTIAVKALAGLIIVVLAGSSVSIAGPIGFIGIVIPHISRFFIGIDHRWVIPYCAVLGAIVLILSDLAARFMMIPEEMPVGVMTAVIGAPFFIYIARRGLVKS